MLEKTLKMLESIAPGMYVPDAVACYDDAEVTEFGRLLERLVYAPSQVRRRLQALGVTITRADFYSETPTVAELEASYARPSRLRLDKPFADAAFLKDFLADLSQYAPEFAPPVKQTRLDEYAWEGAALSYSDAMAYCCMIRRYKPKTIIELGCGSSTLIASLACDWNGEGRIVAVEPFPAPFLRALPRVQLIEARVQDLDESFVASHLADGDMVFVDTTHTVKHDSECLHIYLRIPPHISNTIYVHVHDVYLPFPLPLAMQRDHQVLDGAIPALCLPDEQHSRPGVVWQRLSPRRQPGPARRIHARSLRLRRRQPVVRASRGAAGLERDLVDHARLERRQGSFIRQLASRRRSPGCFRNLLAPVFQVSRGRLSFGGVRGEALTSASQSFSAAC